MRLVRIDSWILSASLLLGLASAGYGGEAGQPRGEMAVAGASGAADLAILPTLVLAGPDGSAVRSFTAPEAERLALALTRSGKGNEVIDRLYDRLEQAGATDLSQDEPHGKSCLTVNLRGTPFHLDLRTAPSHLLDRQTGEQHVRFTREDARTIYDRLRAEGWDQGAIMRVLFGQRFDASRPDSATPVALSIAPASHLAGGGVSGPVTEGGPINVGCDTCADGVLCYVCRCYTLGEAPCDWFQCFYECCSGGSGCTACNVCG